MSMRKLERKDLAALVDATPQIVGTWMKAETAPKGRSPHRVASALQIDPAWLIDGSGSYLESFLEISSGLVQEAQVGYDNFDNEFLDFDPIVVGQAGLALMGALSRLQISMEEERLGKALFKMVHRAKVTGEKPTEAWAIEVILNP